MADVFNNILGQAQVREFMRNVVASDRLGQAYLFLGPAGSNKTQAAFSLAAAAVCENGTGCGRCEACRRVERRSHPDVRFYAPEGASGYLIEQIRSIMSDVSLAPIQAKRKVYIMDRVDRLSVSAANAFLKTLEEPPEDVLLILLARTRESVLPTILSRCQVIPFRHIPVQEAAAIVCQNAGVTTERARIAMESCNGSISRAIEFCRSNERLAFRQVVMDAMRELRMADDLDVLQASERIVSAAKAPLDAVSAQMQADLEANADFLSKPAMKQIEQRNKRALSAQSMQSLQQTCSMVRSWLRDVLCICAGTPELLVNVDVRSALEDAVAYTDEARLVRAMAAVDACEQAIAYNVSPQTCIDAMLFEVRSIVYGRS